MPDLPWTSRIEALHLLSTIASLPKAQNYLQEALRIIIGLGARNEKDEKAEPLTLFAYRTTTIELLTRVRKWQVKGKYEEENQQANFHCEDEKELELFVTGGMARQYFALSFLEYEIDANYLSRPVPRPKNLYRPLAIRHPQEWPLPSESFPPKFATSAFDKMVVVNLAMAKWHTSQGSKDGNLDGSRSFGSKESKESKKSMKSMTSLKSFNNFRQAFIPRKLQGLGEWSSEEMDMMD